MLAHFLIQLLMFCAVLVLAGWVVQSLSRRAHWPDGKDALEPYAGDSWFARHPHH